MLKIVALMSKNDTFMLTLETFMLTLRSIIDPKTTTLSGYINNERGI
jgi:hypothetical protein